MCFVCFHQSKYALKSKGAKSLLCFQCFHGLCAIRLLYICMCYIGARPTQIVFKIILLFFKKYLDGLSWSALIFPCSFAPFYLPFIGKSQKFRSYRNCRHEKNGLIKRFSRVGPIITHSRESSNSQRDPQDHAHSWGRPVGDLCQQRGGGHF